MKPNILKNHPHTEQQNHIIAIKTLRNKNYGKAKLTVATNYPKLPGTSKILQ